MYLVPHDKHVGGVVALMGRHRCVGGAVTVLCVAGWRSRAPGAGGGPPCADRVTATLPGGSTPTATRPPESAAAR